MAALAPMPRARDKTAVSVKVGVRTSVRAACLRSRRQSSSHRQIHAFLTFSWTLTITRCSDGKPRQMVGSASTDMSFSRGSVRARLRDRRRAVRVKRTHRLQAPRLAFRAFRLRPDNRLPVRVEDQVAAGPDFE